MTQQQQNTRTVTGTVWRVNDTGLKLDEIDGWFNFSKHKAVARPGAGDRVILTLTPWQDTEFITHVAYADFVDNEPAELSAPPAPLSTAARHATPDSGTPPHREVMMARESALKSAVEFARGTEFDCREVARIADEWAVWIITGQHPKDDA